MSAPSAGRSLADWASLLLLVACWGSTFALTKLALETMAPMWIVSIRITIGIVFILGVLFWRGERLPTSIRTWPWMIALGALSVTPFFLICWGTQHIDTGLSGILFGVAPLVTIAIAHFTVPGERMRLAGAAGFVAGFAGLVVLMGPAALAGLGGDTLPVLAQLAMVGAASCYALQSIIAKLMPPLSPTQKSAGTFLFAALASTVLALAIEGPPPMDASLRSLAAVAAMGVFSTALSGIVMFRLIHSAGPTFVSLTNYLIPLFTLAVGIALLGEAVSANALLALVLIVTGIALSEGRSTLAALRGRGARRVGGRRGG